MAIYIDRNELPEDISYIPEEVLRFVLQEHRSRLPRLEMLHDAYMGRNIPDTEIKVVCNYPRYVVDIVVGMYLGEAVKYSTDRNKRYKENQYTVRGGGTPENPVPYSAKIKQLENERKDYERPETLDSEINRLRMKLRTQPSDIQPLIDCYNRQAIADADMKIGKHLGQYGEAYELEYVSDGQPKTIVYDPRCCVMVRDTSNDHNKLFFMVYEKRKRIDNTQYYAISVYTDTEHIEYYSDTIEATSFIEVGREPHFFQEVPAVEYENNEVRQGDYETAMSIINNYNRLMSNRIVDKEHFIEAVLFLYGFALSDEQKENLKRYGIIDTLPSKQEGASAEYLQKQLDETSIHILATELVKEIHKQTLTVDMTEAAFGTASGQALKLKLLTMVILIKNKIRTVERGLKKRADIYMTFLDTKGEMKKVDKEDIDIVFTTSLPSDEQGLVNTVVSLQNIVDDETLLGQLPFVKDPIETIEKVKLQKMEDRQDYFDTFGFKDKENTFNGEDGITSRESGNESEPEYLETDKQDENRRAAQIRKANKKLSKDGDTYNREAYN